MGRSGRRVIVAASLIVAACATAPGSSTPPVAGTYTLEMTSAAGAWKGSITLDPGGAGTFGLSAPITILEAPLTYRREGGQLDMTATYTIVENGCTGTVHLLGTPDESGYVGPARVEDGCVGTIEAQFTLRSSS